MNGRAAVLDLALERARLGFDVLSVWGTLPDGTCRCPLGKRCDRKPGKHPIAPDGVWHETHDPDRIATLLSAASEPNYGVIPPVGTFAWDIDGEAIERVAELEAKHGPLPATYTHITRNGRHAFYRWPASIDRPASGNLFGIVTRWPNGDRGRGYLVGPGSHVGDFEYTYTGDPAEIATLPTAWARAAQERDRLPRAAVSDIKPGERHGELRDAARYLAGRGFSGPALVAAVDAINAAFPEPKAPADVLRAIGDVQRFPVDPDVTSEPPPVRPGLANIRTATKPPDSDEWHIEGLARPGAIVVIGSAEGIGKSHMRKEMEVRLGTGRGPLFGHFAIPGPLTVATFEEENGDAEEWRRDEQVMTALAVTRADLEDRVYRVSYPGVDLTKPDDQEYIRSELDRVRADVAWFDTGGSMIGEEWGDQIKSAFRFLRSLPVTKFLNVHLTKPARNGGHGPAHGSSLSDVMGQWTRQADAVGIASDLGAGRVRLLIRKRVPPQELILAQERGLWVTVATGTAAASRAKAETNVLRAIAGGLLDPEDIRTALGSNDGKKPMAESTFYRAVGNLRRDRLIAASGPPYELTEGGRDAIE